AHLLQGRVSEGSAPSFQLESRRKRTPRERHPRRRRSRRVRLQGTRSPGGRPQHVWQVETFEESEVVNALTSFRTSACSCRRANAPVVVDRDGDTSSSPCSGPALDTESSRLHFD